jgi:hypothetical protein
VTTLAVRGPGWAWLPAVLRSRAYWGEVRRFVIWGPLVGGAPYAMFIFPIPFMYMIGLIPALGAGLLFAAWVTQPAARVLAWPWRVAMGTACALLVAALAEVVIDSGGTQHWFWFGVIAVHGVPAAALLALGYRKR